MASKSTNAITKLTAIEPAQIKRLQAVVARVLAFNQGDPITRALETADAIVELRESLNEPIMQRFRELANTRLGFQTDKDPKKWSKSENKGQGGYPKPYSDAVLKDCLIEGFLRGLEVCGNQINVIAGNCYCTKEGYVGLLRKLPTYSNPQYVIGTPRHIQGQDPKTTWVQVRGSCSYQGKRVEFGIADDDKLDLPIESGFGKIDAIKGKAERRLMKIVYERLTGILLTDGDVNDVSVPELPQAPEAGQLGRVEASGSPDASFRKETTRRIEPAKSLDSIKQKCMDLGITQDEFVAWCESMQFSQGCETFEHLLESCPTKLAELDDSFENIAEEITDSNK